MRRSCWTGILSAAVTCCLAVIDAVPVRAAGASSKPNIVFILADDQGWNGTSVAMHPDRGDSKSDFIQTPNLERLAQQRNLGLIQPAPDQVIRLREPGSLDARSPEVPRSARYAANRFGSGSVY